MRKFFEIILGIMIGLAFSGLLYLTVRAPAGEPVVLLPSPTPEPIFVYLTGAVQRPGVYQVPPESHLVDVIELAGGFLEGADLAQVNLAEKVVDGSQVVIPGTAGIPTPQLTIGGNGLLVTPTPPAGKLVNLNTASAAELEQLPGVGPTTAQKIVEYRQANGPFTRVEDLLKIPGLGPSSLEEIRGLVTVGP
jgi:competence protein ComEA